MKSILIKDANVFFNDGLNFAKNDILIEEGIISEIASKIQVHADLVINAQGLIAAPGLIDIHVHTRDPGFTHKDDIISVSECAAAGGFTTIVSMPNTNPAVDNIDTLNYIIEKSKSAKSRILPCAAITCGLKGEQKVDVEALRKAGAVAFSDDGVPVSTAKILSDTMQDCKKHGGIVMAHCEDKSLLGNGIINEGPVSKELGVEGIPIGSESVGVAREIALAKSTGSPIHICHVSTSDSVDIIMAAKADGVNVTAETGPHYFVFTEEALLDRDADFRMNPPLRGVKDRQSVIEALKDGTIDLIATDHAPHTKEEKSDFEKAPNGVVGLETSLAAGITYLVNTGHLSLGKLIELMSINPAKVIGLPEPGLIAGTIADIVVFDPEEEWEVDIEKLHGKSKNTPFKGMKLKGRVKHTIFDGNLVYSDKN